MKSPLNILLPVKNLSHCKQRLATVLTGPERQHLVMTLLEKNLQTLAAHWPEHNKLVITPDPTVATLAEHLRVPVLHEPEAQGLNAAVDAGTRWSLAQGYEAQLVLAPDIAELNIHELQQVFDHLHKANYCELPSVFDHRQKINTHEFPQVFDYQCIVSNANAGSKVIIAAADDGGTNVLLTQPPNAIPFQYGARSAALMHLSSEQRGISSELLNLPHLALDIDTPSDLLSWQCLIEKKNPTGTQTDSSVNRHMSSPSIKATLRQTHKTANLCGINP